MTCLTGFFPPPPDIQELEAVPQYKAEALSIKPLDDEDGNDSDSPALTPPVGFPSTI